MKGKPCLGRSWNDGKWYCAPVQVVEKYGRRTVAKIADALIEIKGKEVSRIEDESKLEIVYEKKVASIVFKEVFRLLYSVIDIANFMYFNNMTELEKVCKYVYENIVKKKTENIRLHETVKVIAKTRYYRS